MDFKSEKNGDIVIIHVYLTRATLAKAVQFKDFVNEIIQAGTNKIIIDLGICEYIDSTFLGAMVALLKKVNTMNGDLRLVYNKEMPSLVFVLTRMDKVFKVFPLLDEALESFGRGKPKLSWK
ncbi:MAG: STAS domain-containing protein [Bacteroidetes bacterium]|nr:STAS domain-containing protein [Bacteroidota bacterium]MCL4551644.1 STAS domain-containing protein [Bacteroidota bacterium]